MGDYVKQDFDDYVIGYNISLTKYLDDSGILQGKHSAVLDALKQKCHQHLMDHPDEIKSNPYVANKYMRNYV